MRDKRFNSKEGESLVVPHHDKNYKGENKYVWRRYRKSSGALTQICALVS